MVSASDPRINRWASTLTGYCTNVQPGDVVAITGSSVAEPLLRAVYRETLKRGGHPILLIGLPGACGDLLHLGDDAQIAYLSPIDRFPFEDADVRIMISSDANTRSLSAVDPAKQTARNRARTPLRQAGMQRAAAGLQRWSLTLFPTDGYAMDAEMDSDAFAEFVFEACRLNVPDPAAAWQEQSRMQAAMIEHLRGHDEVRITAPDTDLTLSIAGRTWINSDGKRNFPSGEIFTGPVENSVNGHIRFSFPVVTQGRAISDIRLRFEDGAVVDASAASGEEFLIRTLDTDAGSRHLGEFAFGTNFGIQRFIKNILFDEKIGGTVHMAIGAGYPETGSTNDSSVHWDLICDLREEGVVTIDGTPFLHKGRYLLD